MTTTHATLQAPVHTSIDRGADDRGASDCGASDSGASDCGADGRRADDDGSVSVFVAGILLTFLLAIGLVYDGGQVLTARRQAITTAQAAARAATATADPYDQTLEPGAAAQAARRYLDAAGVAGLVAVNADAVTIDVTVVPQQVFFPLIGGTPKPAHGHAVAAIQLVPPP